MKVFKLFKFYRARKFPSFRFNTTFVKKIVKKI